MAVDTLARAIAAGKTPVTAYDEAVKAGYTGTEEQFAQDMGNSGTNAANAAASASAAAASAESVAASAAQIATNTSDISDLKESLKDVSAENLTITESDLTVKYFSIDPDGTYKRSAQHYKSGEYKLSGQLFKKLTVTANSNRDAVVAFAKKQIPDGLTADTNIAAEYLATGETGSEIVPVGTAQTLTIPVDTIYIYILINRWATNNSTPVSTIAYTEVQEKISDLSAEIDTKQDALTFDDYPVENSNNPVTSDGIYKACENINEKFSGANITNFTQRYGYNTSNTIDINNPTSNTSVECMYYACTEGDTFRYVDGKGSNNYRCYAFIDGAGNVLEKGSDQYVAEAIIVAPANSAYVIFNNLFNYYPNCVIYKNGGLELEVKKANNIPDYQGCKLSLLGDSFSAIEGYSTGNHNYYPNSASDVQNVDEMWWKIVADYFGMTPLVIGAWSGSCVADGVRAGYTPASSATRCEALDDGTNMPDIVLIAMGVNDYSYSETAEQFGTWDGTTALGTQSDLSDYNNTTFKTAYATMLARIQKKYPSAFIVCITPWFQKRRTTDTGANYLNAIGKSISDYANAVKDICEIMHVTCIDGTDIGFNRYNYYPTYCQDATVSSTHPNIAGQSQIAKAIIAQLKNIHRLGS